MPIIRGKKIIYQLGHGSGSPADSTTYYWGLPSSIPVTATATWRRFYPLANGIITKAALLVNCSHGTNEDVTYYIRKNNTTDYLVGTFGISADNCYKSFSGLNIPIADGDYLEVKQITPAWVTNPTAFIEELDILIITS